MRKRMRHTSRTCEPCAHMHVRLHTQARTFACTCRCTHGTSARYECAAREHERGCVSGMSVRNSGIMQTRFPNPKSQILQTGIWFLERVLTTKISPTEKLLWSERITKNQIPVVRAKYLQISASAAVVVYFHRTSWIWDLGFGIWDLRNELHNPSTISEHADGERQGPT